MCTRPLGLSNYFRRASPWLMILGLSMACATKDPGTPVHSLTEAYALMDRGENAKAILVLEALLAIEPNSAEARILLSSAYLGSAGVDVYRAHDHFQDIIFNKSLGSRLWGEPDSSDEPGAIDPEATPIERLLSQIDAYLGKLRQIVLFLNRFPHVERTHWPLLERAVEILEPMTLDSDARLYRIFLNVVYFRAYLSDEIIRDPTLGTEAWMCRMDVEHFRDSVIWSGKRLLTISNDYQAIRPENAFHLVSLHGFTAALVEELMTYAPAGSRTATYVLQTKIREKFGCTEILRQ